MLIRYALVLNVFERKGATEMGAVSKMVVEKKRPPKKIVGSREYAIRDIKYVMSQRRESRLYPHR